MDFSELKIKILENIEKIDKEKPIKINGEEIINVEKFIKSHIKIIERNRGNKTFLPYYLRLLYFYNNFLI